MKIQKAQEWAGPVPSGKGGESVLQTGRFTESLRKVRLADPLPPLLQPREGPFLTQAKDYIFII